MQTRKFCSSPTHGKEKPQRDWQCMGARRGRPPCGSGRASPELACPRPLQLRARSPWGCQATSGLSKPKDSSHKQGNAGSESDRPSPQHIPGSGRAKEGTQAFKNARTGTSLVVQWLRLRTPNAGVGARFNPWPGN